MRSVKPPRQVWLSRLQVINWGVFDNYHDLRFTRTGTLVAGASGSGKSSLLDAISLAFLSAARRNFNASADPTAAGSNIGKRSVDKYVRGLWGEVQQPGEKAQLQFLRGESATWSAAAVTYTGSDGSVVTGLVLKWLSSAAYTDASSSYHIIHAEADILELCNTWHAKGYARSVFESAGWQGKRDSERWYLNKLYSAIGLQGSPAALQLLGKAKSLKSVGGLEQFVREYMLDVPESFAGIDEAVGQINPLVEARHALSVATHKRKTLGDIEEIQLTYGNESIELAKIQTVDKQMVKDWVDERRRNQIGPEVEHLTAEINRIGAECDAIGEREKKVKRQRDELTVRIAAADRDVTPLRNKYEDAIAAAEEIATRRAAYNSVLLDLGFPEVDNPADFESLRAECITTVAGLDGKVAALQNQLGNTVGPRLSAANDQLQAATAELDRVERSGSAVPDHQQRMREEIAQALHLNIKHLPYVCELTDLRPEHGRWRKAVEKTLRRTGLVLLVPDRDHREVLRYVNQHNMRGLLEIEKVATAGPRSFRQPHPGSLAECLAITDPSHECAAAAAGLIVNKADYVRVDSPDDFARHRRAVTDQGLRQENEHRSVKDDRQELRRSQYIFEGNVEEKVAALREEVAAAQEGVAAADQAWEELMESINTLSGQKQQWWNLKAFDNFSQVDTESADATAETLQIQLEELLAANPDLETLERQSESLYDTMKTLAGKIGTLRQLQNNHDDRRTQLLELEEALNRGPAGSHLASAIENYVAQMITPLDVLSPGPYQSELWGHIEKEQAALGQSVARLRRQIEQIIELFDSEFAESIPNNSADLDEKVHDYVALCKRITERELPEANERMQLLITQAAPTAILRLHQLAEEEAQHIQDQIARVNLGLGAVEFNRGSRLRLHADPKELPAVKDLNARARRISARAAQVSAREETAVHAQYAEILELRKLLAADTAEARQWRRDALDVRNRFTLYCAENDVDTNKLLRTHSNAGANSGGEQEKLMAFCLAGALSFNLADPESDDNRPVFAQLMLDEAFSKSDPVFARQALSAFRQFGFQLIIVATVTNSTTIEPYVDNVVMVSKPDTPGAVASTQSVTVSRLGAIRHELAAQASVSR